MDLNNINTKACYLLGEAEFISIHRNLYNNVEDVWKAIQAKEKPKPTRAKKKATK